ncbi:MAG: DUF481 domain-containing protein [Bacteroides sp.]|jgi:hypothetical protein|nr:DUF481 domain-containing protein [Bacteroides sp.]
MLRFYTFIFFLLILPYTNYAQNDTLYLNNGDVIVGDLKSLDRGVLTIEPSYSDSDFKITWEDITEMKATQRYLITLSDGRRITGTFRSAGPGKIFIDDEQGEDITVGQDDVVNIKSLENGGFLSRLSANIDFGLSLTKANNQRQLNGNIRMGYLEDRWSADLYFNSLITTQDNVSDIQRNDGGLGYRYFLPADWNVGADLNFLSNTEQSLELRATAKVGVGNFLRRTNSLYWNVYGGIAYTGETFSPVFNPQDGTTTAPSRQSMEGFFGTELNLYDIGDLNLLTNLVVYPTLVSDESVESGRIRTDLRFDAKYDDVFIKDFYVRAGFTLNYDNRPAEAGRDVDYIFTTGFGWKW